MGMQEYDCYECKDWGTTDTDEPCPAEGCPAAARRAQLEVAAAAPAPAP